MAICDTGLCIVVMLIMCGELEWNGEEMLVACFSLLEGVEKVTEKLQSQGTFCPSQI